MAEQAKQQALEEAKKRAEQAAAEEAAAKKAAAEKAAAEKAAAEKAAEEAVAAELARKQAEEEDAARTVEEALAEAEGEGDTPRSSASIEERCNEILEENSQLRAENWALRVELDQLLAMTTPLITPPNTGGR
eukprot:TRINITY_DN10622_c0_g2_i5.p3 TRINITY_DN10622_c0_g2~~TRINITY_DN10622_c0_g2_i5.p3  ORF type:complete len:133 (-),score=76.00 TRINITY_DN10622_c0_g2_i5:436-834(-)